MTARPGSEGLPDIAALLREADNPGFAEPWQAQAFGCAIALSRQGVFTWSEWVQVFSAEIKANPATLGESANAAYFRQWLAALETIVTDKGASAPAEIAIRQEEWRKAYLNTPHGQPVELDNASHPMPAGGQAHHHLDHHEDERRPSRRRAAPRPFAVSPAGED
jgi:nitrile hydratase accessory protein